MYPVSPLEVFVLDRVKENPLAAARLERMLAALSPGTVADVGDAGLAEVFRQRGWNEGAKRTGQHRMTTCPALIFNTFRWEAPEELDKRARRHPELRSHMLLGQGPWTFRDHTVLRRAYDTVCQSAWEIHCAFGCLHACDYCHVPPFFNIMLDLEQLARHVRAFGDTIPEQKLYKFDNYTDTITLEPEYGASAIMVRTFADWPGRYLLLYTKSDNVDHLLDLEHNGHTLISWSLGCATVAAEIEKGTPSADERIRAIEKCQNAGYRVRVRISPICPVEHWREEYAEMLERLLMQTAPEVISIDVIGWMDAAQMLDALDVELFESAYAETVRQLAREGVKTNGKHLFPHEMRAEILRFVLEQVRRIRPEQPVSLCNETTAMWRELGPLIHMAPEHYVCCCGPDSVPGHPLFLERNAT